jgi:hypothetical protein
MLLEVFEKNPTQNSVQGFAIFRPIKQNGKNG